MTQNDDEDRAKVWIESQGHADIRRPVDDPPDYVVDGHIAVEVRRLNLPKYGEAISLDHMIVDVLAEFGSPTEGQTIFVNYHYSWLSSPNPGKKKKEIKRQLREALRSTTLGSVLLQCGLRLRFLEPQPSLPGWNKFEIGVSGLGPAYWVIGEMKENIPKYIREKSCRVRNKNRVDQYSCWWLLLVDHVYLGNPNKRELEELREAANCKDFWSKVIIINAVRPTDSYTL